MVVLDVERLGDRTDDPLCQRRGVLGLGERSVQNGELVAAEAGDDVVAPARSPQAVAGRAEESVANGVAEEVVDALEVIEVDPQHGHALATLDAGRGRHHALAEMDPVGKVGERVVAARWRMRASLRRSTVMSWWVDTQPPSLIG